MSTPKKKLTILVDMDDTIENLLVEWVGFLNEEHGTRVSLDDVRSWNLHESFPSLTKAQVYLPLQLDELWTRVKPKWDAVEILDKLRKDGHEIYIVTSSNYQTIKTKMHEVLFKWFPWIDWQHVIIAARKQMIRGDVMIDDAPHNLEGGEYTRILMTAPHNLRYDAASNEMFRVHNWYQVYDLIGTLTNE